MFPPALQCWPYLEPLLRNTAHFPPQRNVPGALTPLAGSCGGRQAQRRRPLLSVLGGLYQGAALLRPNQPGEYEALVVAPSPVVAAEGKGAGA